MNGRLPLNIIGLLAALTAASCQNPYSYDYYKRFFLQPYDKTELEVIGVQKIAVWNKGAAPETARTIGYLEKCRVRVEGTRGEEEFSFIRNHPDYLIVGKVTEKGDFYRYDERHDLVPVGSYPIGPLGFKMFFNLPLSTNVRLDVPEDE